ncbi:MAG: hypothetical protein ACKOK8_05260 [Planctomycetia bacterium]
MLLSAMWLIAAAPVVFAAEPVAATTVPASFAAPLLVVDRANRDIELIDDEAASDGKAVELKYKARSTEKGPLQVVASPVIGPLPHGLYRFTARLKMQALPRSLGTGITLAVHGLAPDGKTPGAALAARAIYPADFEAEDAWQEFTVDFDLHPPFMPPRLFVTERNAITPARVVVTVSIAADSRAGGGSVGGSRGHSTPFASLRRLQIDTLAVAAWPEPRVVIRDVRARKAWLRPGERQDFEIDLHNRSGAEQTGEVRLTIESGRGERHPLPALPFTLANGDFLRLPSAWDVPADHPLWGQTAIAEAVVDGETVASWRTWFTIHPRSAAVMIPHGQGEAERVRFHHPTATKPNVANLAEYWAPTPYDSAGQLPADPAEPFFSGNSGKVESLARQKRIAGDLADRGIASYFYLEGHGTGEKAWQLYWDHPEWCGPGGGPSDEFILKQREAAKVWFPHFLREEAAIKRALGLPLSAAEQDAAAGPAPPALNPAASPIPHLGFVKVNSLFKPVADGIIDLHRTIIREAGYVGCRWDSALPLACFGTDALGKDSGKNLDEIRSHHTAEIARYLAEVRAEHPHFEFGINYNHGPLMNRRDDPFDFASARQVIDDDPACKAVLADGGYILEEGWGHSFEVWSDYKFNCRNYLRACRAESAAYKHAGGQHGHMFRDNGVSYTPDDIYQQLFSLLGGAHHCLVNYGPLPECDYDLGVYAARFGEFFWDTNLRQLEAIGEKVVVEADADLWIDEAGFEKDLPSGNRIYVLPIINPPVTETWLKNRYGQLPEPIRQPIAVTVQVPEGFGGVASVHDLAASPWPEPRKLEFETDGREVRFEFPELVTFKVAVIEFQKE